MRVFHVVCSCSQLSNQVSKKWVESRVRRLMSGLISLAALYTMNKDSKTQLENYRLLPSILFQPPGFWDNTFVVPKCGFNFLYNSKPYQSYLPLLWEFGF